MSRAADRFLSPEAPSLRRLLRLTRLAERAKARLREAIRLDAPAAAFRHRLSRVQWLARAVSAEARHYEAQGVAQ